MILTERGVITRLVLGNPERRGRGKPGIARGKQGEGAI